MINTTPRVSSRVRCYTTATVDHAATLYTVRMVELETGSHLVTCMFGSENHGTAAIITNLDCAAWSYLREKLDLREGDRAGWQLAFRAVGIAAF